jgi:hypothetical protein
MLKLHLWRHWSRTALSEADSRASSIRPTFACAGITNLSPPLSPSTPPPLALASVPCTLHAGASLVSRVRARALRPGDRDRREAFR